MPFRSFGLLALFVLAVSPVFLFAQSPPPAGLDGEWIAVKGTRGGRELDPEHLTKVKVTISRGSITVAEPGISEKAALVNVAFGKPGTLDLRLETRGKTITLEGIFELNGDDLALCLSKSPEKGTRPKAFEATAETVSLLRLKRVK